MKLCNICSEKKNIEEFVKDKNAKNGFRNHCKKCENLKRRKTKLKLPKSGNKYCTKCDLEKPIENFNKRKISGQIKLFSWCKECEREYNNNRYNHQCKMCKKHYKTGKKKSDICHDCHVEFVFKTDKNPNILSTLDLSGRNNGMYGVRRFGKSNPNYNHDMTDEERISKTYRLESGYNYWRRLVFKRDKYTCQCCGSFGKKLNAHHLDGYNWCLDKRTDINNGVTLCKSCHEDFHSIYGKGNNTKGQYVSWIRLKLHNAQ